MIYTLSDSRFIVSLKIYTMNLEGAEIGINMKDLILMNSISYENLIINKVCGINFNRHANIYKKTKNSIIDYDLIFYFKIRNHKLICDSIKYKKQKKFNFNIELLELNNVEDLFILEKDLFDENNILEYKLMIIADGNYIIDYFVFDDNFLEASNLIKKINDNFHQIDITTNPINKNNYIFSIKGEILCECDDHRILFSYSI
jgi:hypothetical protein